MPLSGSITRQTLCPSVLQTSCRDAGAFYPCFSACFAGSCCQRGTGGGRGCQIDRQDNFSGAAHQPRKWGPSMPYEPLFGFALSAVGFASGSSMKMIFI